MCYRGQTVCLGTMMWVHGITDYAYKQGPLAGTKTTRALDPDARARPAAPGARGFGGKQATCDGWLMTNVPLLACKSPSDETMYLNVHVTTDL